MFAFLANPWVIGIGGGVVSGLFVTLVTRWLFSRRERREYFQRVETANNELVYAVRPSVAEKTFPTAEVLDSLRTATATKYALDRDDLHNPDSLADSLIKEVMDNTFLSPQQKEEFCALLAEFRRTHAERTTQVERKIEVVRVGARNSAELSAALGITTALVAMAASLFTFMRNQEPTWDRPFPETFEILVVASTVPVFAVVLTTILRRLREVRELRDRNQSRKSDPE